MRKRNGSEFSPVSRLSPAKIAFIYLILGTAWIFFTDRILEFFIRDPLVRNQYQTVKGILYILITSSLLYYLVRCYAISIHRSQAAQRETERTLSTLLGNIPGMAYRCRYDRDWTMEIVSDGCRALTGYAPADLIENHTLSYAELIHPADQEMVARNVETALVENRSFHLVYRIKTASGEEKWVYESGCGVSLPDRHQPALEGFITDITERKRDEEERRRLEAQMQHSQKLESLGVLAGGIAHDFNNLLMGILGNADLALEELGPESPARDTIQSIQTASVRAAELTHQLLAYSGKGRFNVESINLSSLVEEMSQLLRVSLSKTAVLRQELAPDLPLIQADASQIRQVVMNLITNASDAIGNKNGTVSIQTGVMMVDKTYLSQTFLHDDLSEGRYVFAEVTDTGCGMDAETQSKIFDPFYTTKFTGRGLGLAAVLGIVRSHRGAIKVHSEPGQGTTFKVLFPVMDQETSFTEPQEEDDTSWMGQGSILVIDDEEAVRDVSKRMLARLGFHALLARDGREGVEMFSKHRHEIKAVLMDMTMPHMGGEQTFFEIRRIATDVPVILCSGYTELEATSSFEGKGLAGFLQKPFRPMQLRELLRRLLDKPAPPP